MNNLIYKRGLQICLLATTICLFPVLLNGWVNWDDQAYILNNGLIRSLTGDRVLAIFNTRSILGNYHPITILSYAFEYNLVASNPFLYHLDNLLLHLINVILVYAFVRKMTKQYLLALLIALLFGIHPMHVESVAWVSARKDLLSTMFYLVSLLSYLNYRAAMGWKSSVFYATAFLTFLMALLSKSMAISLPFILVALDYYVQRPLSRRAVLEKAPFFLFAFLFAILAIWTQQKDDAMKSLHIVPFYKTVFVASYNALVYTVKALVPYKLSAFHPYPFLHHTQMPGYIYFSPILLVGLIYFGLNKVKNRRLFVFAVAFFLITILPVLKILPFGRGIMADRYSYLPYLGVFLFAGDWIVRQITNGIPLVRDYKKMALILSVCIFGAITFKRTMVWKNGETLWRDVTTKYPNDFLGHVNLADYYKQKGEREKALKHYSNTLNVAPNNIYALLERGRLRQRMNQLDSALLDFDHLIKIQSKNYSARINRAALYFTKFDQVEKAIADLDTAIMWNPSKPLAYINRGVMLESQKNYRAALANYTEGISKNREDPKLLRYRGVIGLQLGEPWDAIEDFTKAIDRDPFYAEAYFLRAIAHKEKGDTEKALQDAKKAQELKYEVTEAFFQSLQSEK